MLVMRASFISALSRINQHIAQQDDASKPAPVERKKSEEINGTYVSLKRKPFDPTPDFTPLKFRKSEPFCPVAIAHKHEVKPRPGLSDNSGASTDKVKRPVQTKLLSKKQPSSEIVLPKGSHPPPLILAEKIKNCEDYFSSQKLSRIEKAKQLKFQSHVLGNGVYTAKSIRPGAGKGLYAGMNFNAHVLITECVGKMETVPSDVNNSKLVWDIIGSNYESWSHLVEISDHQVLQCIKEPVFGLGGGSFANDSRPDEPNSGFVRIKDKESDEYRIFVKSLRPVKAGEEITVSYGDAFWRSYKEVFPEQYENIFGKELFNIEGWDEAFQEALHSHRKQGLVNLLNRNKTVPQWDELKNSQTTWSTELCIYALYKYRRFGPEKLTLKVLSLLKPDSDHYFTALGEHVACQKRSAKDIVSDWQRAKNKKNQTQLEIPANGVFLKDTERWGSQQINVFYRFFDQVRYFQQINNKKSTAALMHVLKTLNPGHPLYEQLMTEYIFRYLETDFDQTINFNSEHIKDRFARLNTLLWSSAPPVPTTVCGEPLGPNDKWCVEYVRELLHRKGVCIITTKAAMYQSPLKQLDILFHHNSENEYQTGLLSFCRERKCKFSTIVRDGKTSRMGYAIQFKRINGVTFNQKYCDKHALFFQYIHRSGIDRQEVYQQATSETLYKCIRMITPKYKGQVSQRELLALALSRFEPRTEVNRKAIEVAIRKVRNSLPSDLATLSNRELCSSLQPLGRKRHKEYEMLP